jgi:hypothetical protein
MRTPGFILEAGRPNTCGHGAALGAELRARKAIQAYPLLGRLYHQRAVRLRRNPNFELAAVCAIGDRLGHLLAVRDHIAHDVGDDLPNTGQRAL